MRRIILRRTALAAAALLLVGLAALTAIRVHGSMALDDAVERFEEAVGPVDFTAYRPAPVPDRENAALPILEATERLDARADEGTRRQDLAALKEQNRRRAPEWSAEDLARARELVASHPEVLALLHRAYGRSGSSFGLDYSAGPEMEIPSLLLALQARDLLFAEARLAWLDDRPAAAVRAVEALAALSRALQGEAPLIFHLVGDAVEISQYRAVQDGLAAGGLEPQVLRRLRATVDERDRMEALGLALGSEGAFLYSIRPNGRYGETLVEERPWLERLEYPWVGDAKVAQGLRYYARLTEVAASAPFANLRERPGPLDPPRGIPPILVVNFRSSLATIQATEALECLARLALDLALEAAEAGGHPGGLPAALDAGPDPFTGNAPLFEPSPDGSATLTIPGGDELWQEARLDRAGRELEAPLFTWHLAPPQS